MLFIKEITGIDIDDQSTLPHQQEPISQTESTNFIDLNSHVSTSRVWCISARYKFKLWLTTNSSNFLNRYYKLLL